MRNATEVLDQYFPEMRWRCLSLAADLDRVQRANGGEQLLNSDPRLAQLRQAMQSLLSEGRSRAEEVQMIFSDEATEGGSDKGEMQFVNGRK